MDGILVDTVDWHFRTWQQLMAELGLSVTREQNEELRGLSRRDSLQILLNDRNLSEEEIQSLLHRKNRYYLAAIENISERDLAPGVKTLLERLEKRGIRLAVASSSQNTRVILRGLGIDDRFETIVDGNSVKNAKPAPDLFLQAAERLGVTPRECLVIEDASAGVEAAHRAGMKVVGIGPIERLSEADRCYESLTMINEDDLLGL